MHRLDDFAHGSDYKDLGNAFCLTPAFSLRQEYGGVSVGTKPARHAIKQERKST